MRSKLVVCLIFGQTATGTVFADVMSAHTVLCGLRLSTTEAALQMGLSCSNHPPCEGINIGMVVGVSPLSSRALPGSKSARGLPLGVNT
jgi:hypothetical protein